MGGIATAKINTPLMSDVPLRESLPIFRPALARLLAEVLVYEAERPMSLSELSRRTGIPLSTVQRDADVLEDAGLIRSDRIGNTRLIEANAESPYVDDLRSLLQKVYGPAALVGTLLSVVPDIDEAFIYGSWARRYRGESGPPPADIDVVVVGDADPAVVYAAAREAERLLRRDVDPLIVTASEWERPAGLLRRIKEGPLVALEVRGVAVDR
jgi:DNA-binding transcriptional ArsR family regulator